MIIFVKIYGVYLLKLKKSQTITEKFSKNLTTSKRSPIKLESDQGAEFYNSTFPNSLRRINNHHYSRSTDKGPSIARRVIRTVRILLKKPVFLAGNANLVSELPSVINKYHNTIHHSNKKTPIESSKKLIEKVVYNNLKDDREKQQPKYKLGHLIRTTDIKRVFSK